MVEQYDADKAFDDCCQRLLNTEDGRHLFYVLIKQSNLLGMSFDPSNQSVTAFNEGRRVVGRNLMAAIDRVAPQHWLTMNKEAAHRAEIGKSQADDVQ